MREKGTSVSISSQHGEYQAHVEPGLLANVGSRLRDLGWATQIAVVTDDRVWALWGAVLAQALQKAGLPFVTFSVPAGEASKTLSTAEGLYDKLLAHHFSRHDVLLTFGGGAVGDVGGFVAATFHRGMKLVHVPTTLLAMVDASLGGKVALNHRLGKNLIGSFYPPKAVWADLQVLKTLSPRQHFEGLAEMVKAGLVADAALFHQLEARLEATPETILHAMQVKGSIVSSDETEVSQRALLNFGHTFGHALEKLLLPDTLSHGEAVVVGMKLAVRLSVEKGLLSVADSDRSLKLLSRFPLPSCSENVSWEALKEALQRDKKGQGGRPRWVLLEKPGVGTFGHDLDWHVVQKYVRVCLDELRT